MNLKLLPMVIALAVPAAVLADGLRDPMRPPMPEAHGLAAREAAPVLSAVFANGAGRSAIFNGQLVRPGSTVGAYRIDDVSSDGVRYRRGGEEHELRLAPSGNHSIKKPSAVAATAVSGAH